MAQTFTINPHLRHSAVFETSPPPGTLTLDEHTPLPTTLQLPARLLGVSGDSHLLSAKVLKRVRRPQGHLITVVGTTAWFHAHDVAHWLTDQILHTRIITKAVSHDLRLALHECLRNAIIHGNLGIGSSPRAEETDVTTLQNYYAQVEERLKLPPLAEKHIILQCWQDEVLLSCQITDQGAGCTQPLADVGVRHLGLGLTLVRQVVEHFALKDEGRTAFFTLPCALADR